MWPEFVIRGNTLSNTTHKFVTTGPSQYLRQLILLLICTLCAINLYAQDEQYVTLRKFLTARMYGEAYNELLRLELSRDEIDPKLEKLRIDLLERTKERLLRQARVSPDDPAIFTILADIDFHQGNLEEASKNISKALTNKSGPVANYVFAKILFRKGSLVQAFDQMGSVLEAMPDSPVVFEDFQFLYACKSYGIATARKISRNTNFIKRATPVAAGDNVPEIPESPFENDPTQVAALPATPPEAVETTPAPINAASVTEEDDDLPFPDDSGDTDEADILPDESTGLPDESDEPEDEDFVEDEPAQTSPAKDPQLLPPRPTPVAMTPEPPQPETDPEKENIKKAEYWLQQAVRQFENRNYDDAQNNWKSAVELHADLPGKDELKTRLDAKFGLFKRYREAKDLFELEKYDKALPTLEEAYNEEPDRFKEAPFMIGKIYLLQAEPDYDKALHYLDLVLSQDNLDPLFKRDIEWTKMEIFYGMHRFDEANAIFQRFMANEEAFARNQTNFNHLRIGLWYNLNKTLVHIGFGVFIAMFLLVFVLRLLPAITMLSDPLKGAKRMLESNKFQKAIGIAEKALRSKQPIQVEREFLEILVKCHFELKNFVRCQENARLILEKFPGNNIAWSYLAKASMASHDTSNEAITMYETLYRENPNRKEYLPILARHHAQTGNNTVEAMNILVTYYQSGGKEPPIVKALANGYVQNRSMGPEVIDILEEALKTDDKLDYRELLARNFSKCGRYDDAARECLKVLNENINNMGIHVVYTSSMKKLKKLDTAIDQYKTFLQRYPGNPQLNEILNGLKKDLSIFSPSESDLMQFPEDLPMPDLPEPGFSDHHEDIDLENYVEPPPEGFVMEDSQETPLPEFLQGGEYSDEPLPDPLGFGDSGPGRLTPQPITPGGRQTELPQIELPTLDPFEDNSALFNEFASELPEELGGPAEPPLPLPPDSFNPYKQLPVEEPSSDALPGKRGSDSIKSATGQGLTMKIAEAHEKVRASKWDDIIALLSPDFASERNKEAGILLANAWLGKNKPQMALEIIETLDFDPELLNEPIKEVLYRTGLALESEKKLDEALRMYDLICSVDINFKDAFDRSDKIYTRKKSG